MESLGGNTVATKRNSKEILRTWETSIFNNLEASFDRLFNLTEMTNVCIESTIIPHYLQYILPWYSICQWKILWLSIIHACVFQSGWNDDHFIKYDLKAMTIESCCFLFLSHSQRLLYSINLHPLPCLTLPLYHPPPHLFPNLIYAHVSDMFTLTYESWLMWHHHFHLHLLPILINLYSLILLSLLHSSTFSPIQKLFTSPFIAVFHRDIPHLVFATQHLLEGVRILRPLSVDELGHLSFLRLKDVI